MKWPNHKRTVAHNNALFEKKAVQYRLAKAKGVDHDGVLRLVEAHERAPGIESAKSAARELVSTAGSVMPYLVARYAGCKADTAHSALFLLALAGEIEIAAFTPAGNPTYIPRPARPPARPRGRPPSLSSSRFARLAVGEQHETMLNPSKILGKNSWLAKNHPERKFEWWRTPQGSKIVKRIE